MFVLLFIFKKFRRKKKKKKKEKRKQKGSLHDYIKRSKDFGLMCYSIVKNISLREIMYSAHSQHNINLN